MRILVTNDDGIDSAGLHALAAGVHGIGHELVVVAPLENMSGSGASIGYLGSGTKVEVRPTEVPELPGVPAFGVGATPGAITLLAGLEVFGDKPDLVVSGINPGCNTGRSILHSGTVGAALTATNFGISGLAVSVDERPEPAWATAAELAVLAIDWITDVEPGTVLNLNVPAVALDVLRGVRWAEPAAVGAVRTTVADSGDGYLELSWEHNDVVLPADSDTGLIQSGFATVTLLERPGPAPHQPVAEVLEARLRKRSA